MASSTLPRARCSTLLSISSSMYQIKQVHAQLVTNSLLFGAASGHLIGRYFSFPEGALDARLLFLHLLRTPETSPDKFAYTHVLRACAREKSLPEGRQLHGRILKSGLLDSDVAVPTTAVHLYGTCNDISSARRLFDEMPRRTAASYNAMMAACCSDNGVPKEAVLLFQKMVRLSNNVRPTDRTALLLLSACARLGDLAVGSSAHAYVSKSVPLYEDCLFIGTALVDMYAKCGSLKDACQVFERMRKRNVVTWTAMIGGMAIHGRGREALEVMARMEAEKVWPNEVTLGAVLSACCRAGMVEEGIKVLEEMRRRYGVEGGVKHYGCVVDLLGRAGRVEEACEVVRRMPVEADAVAWRAVVGACRDYGEQGIGMEVGRMLVGKGGGGCQDFVGLSNVLASAERWEEVWRVREEMKGKGIQNRAGWSSAAPAVTD